MGTMKSVKMWAVNMVGSELTPDTFQKLFQEKDDAEAYIKYLNHYEPADEHEAVSVVVRHKL